jgi:hypothetical protein
MVFKLTRLEASGFLPVGTSKSLVYAPPVDNKEAIHYHIVDAYQTICNYPSIFERMQWSMMRCALNPMKDILSTCYKFTLSAINHRLNVSGHLLIWTFFSFFGVWKLCPKYVCTFQLHSIYCYRRSFTRLRHISFYLTPNGVLE